MGVSCGNPGEQCSHPNEGVGRTGEGKEPPDALAAAMVELPNDADTLLPAEALLRQFAFALTDGVARVPRRPAVHRTSAALGSALDSDSRAA
jgi:hypothetical protein